MRMHLTDREIVITGGCGLVGAALAEALAPQNTIRVIDDLSKGDKTVLPADCTLIEGDVADPTVCAAGITETTDLVIHAAALTATNHPDPRALFTANTNMTYTVAARAAAVGVGGIAFTSSSTVYGEAPRPTPESHTPLAPISVYGAAKVADEAIISALASTAEIPVWIFRFANVVGPHQRGTVIPDFIEKLRADPNRLEILGDGTQTKSYLHVDDCIAAMLHQIETIDEPLWVCNLGTADATDVTSIAEIVCEQMGVDPTFSYTGGQRGWQGDVPQMQLAIDRLLDSGFTPRDDSTAAIERATTQLLAEFDQPPV
jgi:Nucleoside-diphosphate-sugar epimerases